LVAAAKFLAEATKNSFVVPNFVAVTKPFFSVIDRPYLQIVVMARVAGVLLYGDFAI